MTAFGLTVTIGPDDRASACKSLIRIGIFSCGKVAFRPATVVS
jgi:hypothetical protein